jgi:hypothetical protein
MRFPSERSARRSVGIALVAAGVAWLAAPASAATVSARSEGGITDFVFEVFRTSDRAPLDPESSVAIDPGVINLEVTRTTPGVSTGSESGVAQVFNALDVEIGAVLEFQFSTVVNISVDDPTQRASASAFMELLLDGTPLDVSAATITERSCAPPTSFPCSDGDVESGSSPILVLVPPNGVVQLDIEGTARAELSIIPLPAPAGLMLLGIGAIGWIGRRRAQPGLHL